MEYLDTYDEERNYLGRQTREFVHANGLWHNTVHCWLYDQEGSIYFQRRSDTGTFYTTASGHVLAAESIKEAFQREVKEEIGLQVDIENSELVDIVIWKMDKEKADGTVFRDRAFANVYVCNFHGDLQELEYDKEEVSGIGKVKARDALSLFRGEMDSIPCTVITREKEQTVIAKCQVTMNDFLVMKHETALTKYGDILNKVIELTE